MKELINSATFVRNWMKHQTVEEVAKAMKLTAQQTSSKAYALRAKGVKLPSKPPVHNQPTVAELNAIVDSYHKVTMTVTKPQPVKKSVFGTRSKAVSRV